MAANNDASHTGHTRHLNPWMSAAVGTASAVMLSPYVLPLFGVGSAYQSETIMHAIGGHATVDAVTGAASSYGAGLAGGIVGAISHIPVIGAAMTSAAPVTLPVLGWTIASGTLVSMAAITAVGIGGTMLANWMEKREDPNSHGIRWSKIIRYSALASSALIALPSILSGLSVGVAFLTLAVGGYSAANWTILGLRSSLGATAMTGEAASGIFGMTLPHLISCGGALFPMLTGFFLGTHSAKAMDHSAMHPSEPLNGTAVAELVAASPIVKNSPCTLRFRLRDTATGKLVTPADMDTVYTKKLHTMIVDHSLTDYQHLHPQYDDASGTFVCQFTPQHQQPYRMWNDFTLRGADASTHVKSELPHQHGYEIPPLIQTMATAQAGDVTIHVTANPPLAAGHDSQLSVTVTDAHGNIVSDLAPIMGAYAHLAAFTKDGDHLIHCHPGGKPPTSDRDRCGGTLQFHVRTEQSGFTKFFLQLNRDGHEVTVPFGQYIKSPEKLAARIQNTSMKHAEPALA